MSDTSGFYRWNETNEEIDYGAADIHGPGYDLYRVQHASYTYPIAGWYWFETRQEARVALLGDQGTTVDPLLIQESTDWAQQIQDEPSRQAVQSLLAALGPIVGPA